MRIAITGAYLCGILLSPRLWLGLGRTIPRVPLLNGIPALLSSADYLLSILLVAALILSIIGRRPGRYLIAAVILTLLLVLFDQTRLQPWVYQYFVMLAILANWRPNVETNAAEQILLANQLVIALLYFWSGTQKLNWSFAHEVIPGLFEQVNVQLPEDFISFLPAAAGAVALCEMLIGIGLLIRRTRRTAVILALAMHLLVLVTFVAPRRNSVVWPWNVAMMVMVVLLFWRFDRSLVRKELWRWRVANVISHLPKAVIVICGFAPALSFAGWWDLYLSGALYSGNAPVAVVRISDRVRERLPAVAQQQTFKTGRGELMLPLYQWSLADLNVPPYAEVRVYRQLARHVCALAENSQELELIVKGRPSVIQGKYSVDRFSCKD